MDFSSSCAQGHLLDGSTNCTYGHPWDENNNGTQTSPLLDTALEQVLDKHGLQNLPPEVNLEKSLEFDPAKVGGVSLNLISNSFSQTSTAEGSSSTSDYRASKLRRKQFEFHQWNSFNPGTKPEKSAEELKIKKAKYQKNYTDKRANSDRQIRAMCGTQLKLLTVGKNLVASQHKEASTAKITAIINSPDVMKLLQPPRSYKTAPEKYDREVYESINADSEQTLKFIQSVNEANQQLIKELTNKVTQLEEKVLELETENFILKCLNADTAEQN